MKPLPSLFDMQSVQLTILSIDSITSGDRSSVLLILFSNQKNGRFHWKINIGSMLKSQNVLMLARASFFVDIKAIPRFPFCSLNGQVARSTGRITCISVSSVKTWEFEFNKSMEKTKRIIHSMSWNENVWTEDLHTKLAHFVFVDSHITYVSTRRYMDTIWDFNLSYHEIVVCGDRISPVECHLKLLN